MRNYDSCFYSSFDKGIEPEALGIVIYANNNLTWFFVHEYQAEPFDMPLSYVAEVYKMNAIVSNPRISNSAGATALRRFVAFNDSFVPPL